MRSRIFKDKEISLAAKGRTLSYKVCPVLRLLLGFLQPLILPNDM
jgi:hypothetical protein